MTAFDKRIENQKLVLSAIKNWYAENDYGPSYRDIELMIKDDGHKISLGTVHSTCTDLRDSGKITLRENVARSIRIKKANR